MLSPEDTLALIELMTANADKDSDLADSEGISETAAYYEGWADGLQTLAQHVKTDVKATCFPVGSCACHPFTTKGE